MIGESDEGEWKLCTLVSNPSSRSEEVSSSSKKSKVPTAIITYAGKRKKLQSPETQTETLNVHHSLNSSCTPPKQKFKLDEYNADSIVYQPIDDDEHSEIFAELELTDAGTFVEAASADNKQSQSTEVLKVEDRIVSDSNNVSRDLQEVLPSGETLSVGRDMGSLGTSLDKLESVITKCVELAEKCVVNCANQDSNEVFGKFIASMVRELPPEKRMKARFDIIQFTGDLISKLVN